MKPLKRYFKENGLTAYKVGKENNIPNQTIRLQLENDTLDRVAFRIIKAIANSLNKTPGQVADELIEFENNNKNK